MPDETRELLIQGLDLWEFAYTEVQIEQFLAFRDLLVDWNSTRMNLTRLSSHREIAIDHFLDSLSVIKAVHIGFGASLLDVGAGPGFPSLPLKIFRPDLQISLLEATAKKLTFCEAVIEKLGLEDVTLFHGRAEDSYANLERKFDLVTARAVASLDKLVPWCESYLKENGGVMVALKGAKAREELADASLVMRRLRLTSKIVEIDVPGSDKVHNIVLARHYAN